MTDGWGFLVYIIIYPMIFIGIISFLLLCFFFKWQSFCNFLYSKSFWIAWLFPYYLLLIIVCITNEWELLKLYICILSLPIVYQSRKWYMTNRKNKATNIFSIWIIPISIISLFIHLEIITLYLFFKAQG